MIRFLRLLLVILLAFSPFLTWAQETNSIIENTLKEHNLSLPTTQWQVTRQHTSRTSKIHHIYYQQAINGVLVRGTESGIHISSTGTLLAESNHFVVDISEIKRKNNSDLISPKTALESVIIQMGYSPTANFQVIKEIEAVDNRVIFGSAGVSERKIPVTLTYAPDKMNNYVLVWEVSILELDYARFMTFDINAVTGEVLNAKDNLVRCSFASETSGDSKLDYNANLYDHPNYKIPAEEATICEVCYEVFAWPLESPFKGDRTISQNPADGTASPFGWHDTDGQTGAESFLTKGNNTSVLEMGNNIGYQTSGGAELDFTGFSFNPIYTTENQYEDAALTNVFYWNNIIHDVTYHYGFDEFSNNFQKKNYYVSVHSNDDLESRVQSRIGCQAFYVSGIGAQEKPITILGLCEDKDAAFDTVVIVHEYVHGIVERLLGSTSSCLNNDEQMTEGWADYLGIFLTMSTKDLPEDRRPIGNYFFGQGPNGRGVRAYAYSTDFSVNPQTYGFLPDSAAPHGVGSVWANMLWEMTWDLIDRYGFDSNLYNFTGDINQDAGNVMALAIIIEAIKLMGCNPGFVDAREAILTANEQIYGLDNQCTIFNAFARRGLGTHAEQGSPGSKNDGVENFEEYPTTAQIDEIPPLCFSEGIITGLTGGLPRGGFYSGSGVIDNGNGISFSIDTSISGTGELLLTYEIGDNFCTIGSSSQREITILLDETPPEINCPENEEVSVPLNELYQLPNYKSSDLATDFCSENLILTQDPQEFTSLAEGVHPITLTATDEAGNTSECVFLLKITWIGDLSLDFESSVLLYPIPALDEVTIFNASGRRIISILIHDINGRLIKTINPSTEDLRVPIPISNLSSGNYFFTIQTRGDIIVRRLTKA